MSNSARSLRGLVDRFEVGTGADIDEASGGALDDGTDAGSGSRFGSGAAVAGGGRTGDGETDRGGRTASDV